MMKCIWFIFLFMLFSPLWGDETLTKVQVHIPVREHIDDDFKEVFATLVRAYENKNISEFLKHIHSDFRSLDGLNKRLDYNLLTRSVRDDFKVLANMRFQIFVNSVQQQNDGKRARMELRWDFRAIISADSQQLIEKERETTVVFEKQNNEWKLRSIQGICLFGRSNFQGKLIVEAPFFLDGELVNDDLIIDLFNGIENNNNNGNQFTVTLTSVEELAAFQQVDLLTGIVSALFFGQSVDSENHLGLTSVLNDGRVFIQGLNNKGQDVEQALFVVSDIGKVIREISDGVNVAPLPFGVRIDNITVQIQNGNTVGTLTITFPVK